MANRPDLETELKNFAPLAVQGYSINFHIRHVTPLMKFSTLSSEWQLHYSKSGFALRDPTNAWALSTEGACRWSGMPIPDPFDFFGEAASFGLVFGATVSHGPLASRTIANFARQDREFTDSEIGFLQNHVSHLHDMLRPLEKLTAAQIEALNLVADGNRHSASAAKLRISESAFKARLVSARNRLSARTTAEAIQRAKDYGLI